MIVLLHAWLHTSCCSQYIYQVCSMLFLSIFGWHGTNAKSLYNLALSVVALHTVQSSYLAPICNSNIVITARVCGKVMFSYCLCICSGYRFWMPRHRNFKVTLVKLASWTNLFAMTSLWYWCFHKGQGHIKVTVILRLRSFWNQTLMCFDFYPKAGGLAFVHMLLPCFFC